MKTIASRLQACFAPLLLAVLLGTCTTTREQTPGPVSQHPKLEGRPLAALFDRFGKNTVYDHTAPASELGGEFYTPINRRYPPNDRASRRILIREVRWQRGDRYIAAFSTRDRGEWITFDVVEWHKDIVF